MQALSISAFTSASTLPSDPRDPRFMKPHSPDCPNDISPDDDIPDDAVAGTCAGCAWGFYVPDDFRHQQGEPVEGLDLRRLEFADHAPAGYVSRCGRVEIFADQHGRVGAVRTLRGERRFFPGIKGNWAFERFQKRHAEVVPA